MAQPGNTSLRCQLGWTLVEMILVLMIFGTLLAIVQPSLRGWIDQAKLARAITDIEAIQADLAGWEYLDGELPETLAEIDRGSTLDPWGNPYRYLRFEGAASGDMRKDRFLVPINSTYDLYSMGKDGETDAPLTSSPGKDDVVRANDGAFIGLASKF
jgi:general secretion pathway protein G